MYSDLIKALNKKCFLITVIEKTKNSFGMIIFFFFMDVKLYVFACF